MSDSRSLRAKPYNHHQNTPKPNQKKDTTRVSLDVPSTNRNLRLAGSTEQTPRHQPDSMHQICCICKKKIEMILYYQTRCCTLRYMCKSCHDRNKETNCSTCSKNLRRSMFILIDTSSMRQKPLTCDACSMVTKPKFILPCQSKLCEECFRKETYLMYVKDGTANIKQLYVGCTKHGTTKTLHELQRVHRISYEMYENVGYIICASCFRRLEGKCLEMNCGHFTCSTCSPYCRTCLKLSNHIKDVDSSEIQIRDIISEQHTTLEEDQDITVVRHLYSCNNNINHTYKACVELPCGKKVCVECIEYMADNNAMTFRNDATCRDDIFCNCLCFQQYGIHVMSLNLLKSAVSKIEYVTAYQEKCDQRFCVNNAVVQLQDCTHAFCTKCLDELLLKKVTRHQKIHGKRQFCVCNTYGCSKAVPVDQLEHSKASSNEVQPSSKDHKRMTAGKSLKLQNQEAEDPTAEPKRESDTFTYTLAVSLSMNNDQEMTNTGLKNQVDNRPTKCKTEDDNEQRKLSETGTSYTSKNTAVTETGRHNTEPSLNKHIENQNSSSTNSSVTMSEAEDMDTETLDTEQNGATASGKHKTSLTEKPDMSKAKTFLKPYPTKAHRCNNKIFCRNQGSYCDNPGCKADEKMKKRICHTFGDCRHKLCAQCVSEQKHRRAIELHCRVAKCFQTQSTKDYALTITDPKEVLGIPNVGLTCYANCILQVLGQTPAFGEYLDRFCLCNTENHVGNCLNNLLKQINLGADGQFTINWNLINNLMTRMFKIDRSFRRYEENDCHSFIMSLLNALGKEEKVTKTDDIQSCGKTRNANQSKTNEASEEMDHNGKKQGLPYPSFLFESRLVSKFSYEPCGHEETTDGQLFHSILIPAQKDLQTLKDGLHEFFQAEEFSEGVLSCRVCNITQTSKTTRTLQFAKAPDILMLQLARFEEVDYGKYYYKELRKTDHAVMFEKDLKLIPEFSMERRELEYELYGVVLHSGSMHGGHYTSCVRNLKSKKWYYCSDSFVREICEEEVFEKSHLKNAYVLFYTKK